MENISTQLQQLQTKLQLLLKNYQQLQRENVQLKKELDKTKTALTETTDKYQVLQQQVDVIKLTKASFTDDEKLELEKRINIYLKELDKCLALLNS